MVEGVPAPVVSKLQEDKGDLFHTRFFHFGLIIVPVRIIG